MSLKEIAQNILVRYCKYFKITLNYCLEEKLKLTLFKKDKRIESMKKQISLKKTTEMKTSIKFFYMGGSGLVLVLQRWCSMKRTTNYCWRKRC